MRTTLILFFVLQTFSVLAQVSFNQAYKAHYFQKPAEAYKLKTAFKESDNYEKWDVTYNRVDLSVDPAKWYISGAVYFEITSKVDQLSSVSIDLSNELEVLSIKTGDENLSYSHKNEKIALTFPKALAKNERTNFTINYKGKPTSTGLGAFTQETTGTFNVIYTLSEPFGAMEWWPCKQSLIDKIDSIDMVVTSPEKYRTASNGLLISDKVTNSLRTCHWKHRHPIATYLVFFSNTNYEVYSDWATLESGSKVEILNYVYPGDVDYAKKSTPLTADYMKLFSNMFTDYPFKDEKYGHAQFGWGGGMEHQTMTSMGAFSGYLIAHELAHQWFGDYITCGSWKDIWINEGFATFLTGLTYEHLDTYWYPLWKSSIINSVISEHDGSVYCADTSDVWRIFDGRLSYDKGGFVLHMLRGQLGDKPFFDGMKKYVTNPKATNGFATTDLYREDMEQAADTSLTEFFNDWIYGEGFPIYDINWFYKDQKVNITINQTPSALNGPFFEMKIPIRFYFNGDSVTHWVANTEPGQQISIAMETKPDRIKVDPDMWILARFRSITSVDTILKGNYKVYSYLSDNFLYIDAPEVENANCSIYNVDGKRMCQSQWNQLNKKIEVGEYPMGIYFLQFNSEKTNFTSKFMITGK